MAKVHLNGISGSFGNVIVKDGTAQKISKVCEAPVSVTETLKMYRIESKHDKYTMDPG